MEDEYELEEEEERYEVVGDFGTAYQIWCDEHPIKFTKKQKEEIFNNFRKENGK